MCISSPLKTIFKNIQWNRLWIWTRSLTLGYLWDLEQTPHPRAQLSKVGPYHPFGFYGGNPEGPAMLDVPTQLESFFPPIPLVASNSGPRIWGFALQRMEAGSGLSCCCQPCNESEVPASPADGEPPPYVPNSVFQCVAFAHLHQHFREHRLEMKLQGPP